jgi:Tfp pilus assembly protein PilN
MLEKYYRINGAVGVGIKINPGGNAEISACSITISQNKLDFEKKITGLQNIEELSKHFPAKALLALNLSGKGILQKQIDKTEEINPTNFSKILPNAEIGDFYIQNFISGGKSFVSVIRKTEADKWINHLQVLGFTPLMLSLGPFPVQNIISQLNVYGGDLVFDGHVIGRNEQSEWLSYQYDGAVSAPFPLKAESESLHEKIIVPYAAAFQLTLGAYSGAITAEVPLLAAAYQETESERRLKVQGFLVLSAFFILLLVNFLVLSWLNASNARLTEQVSRSAQSTVDLQKINEQVQQKEALLKTLGYEAAVNKSVLIDQVASLLPDGVNLTEAALDPVDLNSSRNQKAIVFFSRKIRVTGNSDKIIPVNEWIARVKTLKWVKNVQLDSFTVNPDLNTGQFIIVIDY